MLATQPDPILPPPPPFTQCINKNITLNLFTQGRGVGRSTSESAREALVHKRGRKYQHDWLYRQSIKTIQYQQRRHLGFGVFTVIWSMPWRIPVFRAWSPPPASSRTRCEDHRVSWGGGQTSPPGGARYRTPAGSQCRTSGCPGSPPVWCSCTSWNQALNI